MGSKYILFYSSSCKYSNEFKRLVAETRLRNVFKLACIDPIPGTKIRPAWVKKYQKEFLNEVPTIIVNNNVYSGNIAFKWLKTTTGVASKNSSLEGSSEIVAFKEDEMIGNASNWAFVKKDGSLELPIGEYEHLGKKPILQKKDGNTKLLSGDWRKIKKSTIDTEGQNGWQSVNVNKTMDPRTFEQNIREADVAIKTRNTSTKYDSGEFKPVRPRRQINFQFPQMSDSRKDASSKIEQMMASRQAEYQQDRQEFVPQPMYGGKNRYRRHRDRRHRDREV